uniref:Dynein light chain n=1 Tax=Chromera velia CCMP2878 TaxID=1169474 RepID=A0A0G4HTD8_9ALVE|mmetsp:Transcript_8479/g.16532  ORF Transcript_8479/g.16532 Transcript_8479/m.16532 type:complete len:108 (+) Transcript_8479:265-588(+)|eukprot:Cvel_31438.t1-p1 / transcript=Cvel_31438.t1 / gene=Cvel_31438 / organism=Chromera_velia_CCMP2878 / gene_product=Dynein light chain LC6, flagellar outer arm, putative / transcript_product=Dynein light chain LC6, flagellar outer arm, putative / location=Cvel_scaffold4687:4370-7095(+) / protein_length=107 / sequence_SO=supercontig / SO=protein_coding / is_pseudo=false
MTTPDAPEKTEEYKQLLGARVLWPPDMPDNMVENAIEIARDCLEKEGLNPEKDACLIAEKIKKEFDEKWSCYWHVVVGKNFGCHMIHEQRRFLHFYLGQFAFLVFKG